MILKNASSIMVNPNRLGYIPVPHISKKAGVTAINNAAITPTLVPNILLVKTKVANGRMPSTKAPNN